MAYTQKQNNFLWILEVLPVDERGLFLADCISWLVMSTGEFICEEIRNNLYSVLQYWRVLFAAAPLFGLPAVNLGLS